MKSSKNVRSSLKTVFVNTTHTYVKMKKERLHLLKVKKKNGIMWSVLRYFHKIPSPLLFIVIEIGLVSLCRKSESGISYYNRKSKGIYRKVSKFLRGNIRTKQLLKIVLRYNLRQSTKKT